MGGYCFQVSYKSRKMGCLSSFHCSLVLNLQLQCTVPKCWDLGNLYVLCNRPQFCTPEKLHVFCKHAEYIRVQQAVVVYPEATDVRTLPVKEAQNSVYLFTQSVDGLSELKF
eukprot:TRINITY_DN4054_c3_g1_i1.p6 TRINITY_DN4054_c3_g1~~TRINITY_DN4054_c3_g1_i1.p6  ORF type:complete len:112 (+),score=2.62 TRINITY_DN4054_c3_g1_i1:17-352(+)